MSLTLNPSFSMLGWSLAVFLVYVLIQAVLTVGYAMYGAVFHPALGVFVWFSASASIGYALLLRHLPSRADLALLQGFACLYMTLTALAIALQRPSAFEPSVLAQILGVVIGLFVAGLLGFELARVLRDRAPRASSKSYK